LNKSEENYDLKLLGPEHFKELINWHFDEDRYEYFTCRPVPDSHNREEFVRKLFDSLSNNSRKNFVLVLKSEPDIPLGKINLFDYNPRNHSAEFGYYFPKDSRNKGFGSIMLRKFLKEAFENGELNINKLYATTASNNYASIKLLEKFGLNLDGKMREHYWIGDEKFDQLVFSILRAEWEKFL